MTSLSKNMYIDKLDDMVNKYNNTYHKTIKRKPFLVKPSTFIESSEEINYYDLKLKKVKHTVLWTYAISDLKGEEIVGTF